MLLHRLAASTSLGVVGSVTQPSTLTGSAIASQSSAFGPPSAPSSGIDPWYLDSNASFYMTTHSTHLSALRLSYRHCTVHTADGSPVSVARQGTLCSDSFHVPDVSLVPDLTMQLMTAGQITDHDYVLFLILIFATFRIVALVTWLALAPVIIIHNVFGSLTSFVFLPLRPPVLLALLMQCHPRHHLLSGIIICATFVVPACRLYFIEVFYGLFQVESLYIIIRVVD
jgi:hypothetical protein